GGAAITDWSQIGGVHADQQDVAFSPSNPDVMYLANDGGVYRSANRGATWTLRSGGLQITQFYDIDVALNDKSIVVGGAQDNGVYYRDTNGDWRHRPWGDGTGTAADPSDPRIIYFSQQNGVDLYYDPAGNLRSGLARSVDGGATFQFL